MRHITCADRYIGLDFIVSVFLHIVLDCTEYVNTGRFMRNHYSGEGTGRNLELLFNDT